MKLIIEQNDLLESGFDEDLIEDIIQSAAPHHIEVVYDVEPKKAKVISSGCTNQNIASYKAAVGSG